MIPRSGVPRCDICLSSRSGLTTAGSAHYGPLQVLSASDKPRLAGRQPSLRRGAPGDDQAVRVRARQAGTPLPGPVRGAAPVGRTGIRAAATDLVGRPTVDLLRTD